MSGAHGAEFPGLATALDLGAILELLPQALPELAGAVEIVHGRIADVRYRPGHPCWVLYRLKVRDAEGHRRELLLSARLLRAAERAPRLNPQLLARYERHPGRVLRTPSGYLPQAHMAVYAFPIDSALPGLFEALDPACMKRHLSRLWATRRLRVRKVSLRPLRYMPHARAAVGYEVWAEDRDTGLPELRRLIGKMHGKRSAARLFGDHWALWSARGDRIRIAPPVGYVAAAGLTLQEQVRGEGPGEFLHSPRFLKPLRRAARMLAAVHSLSIPLSTRRRPIDEARTVARWAGALVAIRPDLAPRVERLRDRIAAEVESRARLEAPIHADFHHTNVLVDGDDVTIIDLDEMAYGDPMMDVGRFLASLRRPALRAFGDLDGLAETGEAFLTEYLRWGRSGDRRLKLFEAASLFRAAASAYRIQRSGWQEEVNLLLEKAERLADAATRTVVPASSAPGEPALTGAERERWARDPIYMQALLDPHIREAYGADVTSCRVRAGADPAAGPVRYELRGRRGAERWRIALEGVTRHGGGGSHVRRVEAVRSALNGSPDAPVIPRPIAYLRPLSLLVREAPVGERFASLLGRGDAPEAARRVALALAALHATPVELDAHRSLDDEMEALRARIRELDAALAGRATALLQEIERRARSFDWTPGPVLRTVHPRHIHVGERVTFARVESLVLSHPLLDAGDLLARLAALGFQDGTAAAATEAAARFREAYAAARADAGSGLTAFEAAGCLRVACAEARKGRAESIGSALLARAEEALAR